MPVRDSSDIHIKINTLIRKNAKAVTSLYPPRDEELIY